MYTSDHHKKKDSHGRVTQRLKVKFRFRDEIAPKDRHCIYFRLDFEEDGPLRNYLEKYESLRALGDCNFQDANRKVFVNYGSLFYELKVTVSANSDMPLEKMLDLDALNHFVLTGEIPKKPGQEKEGDTQ